ncbi:MAG: glycosyltransferase family 2 protein [Planctomycetota bacterium JB042]
MSAIADAADGAAPRVSVVVPVYDEEGAVAALAREIHAVLAGERIPHEIVFVDDASRDRTVAVLEETSADVPTLVVARHERNCGQSAAVATGFRRARGDVVVTLDGDGQNDPADIPRLLAALAGADAATGVRTKRHDSFVRRASSRIANGFRNAVTGDRVVDAGCGIRAVDRRALREVPVFNGMHRFLPTLLRAEGFTVAEIPVSHRPRTTGRSKYGIGNRLFRGIVDCLAIRWWRARAVPTMRERRP